MAGARALSAFQRGEEGLQARVGALMHAEFQAMVVKFIEAWSEGNSKK